MNCIFYHKAYKYRNVYKSVIIFMQNSYKLIHYFFNVIKRYNFKYKDSLICAPDCSVNNPMVNY